jgi:hypothetical protein
MVDIICDHIFLVYVIVDGVDVVFIIYNLLWVLILKGDLENDEMHTSQGF